MGLDAVPKGPASKTRKVVRRKGSQRLYANPNVRIIILILKCIYEF